MLFLLTISPQELILEKIHGIFYGSPSSPQLQRICFFFIKSTKNNLSSASDWSEYNKSCFKENATTFSKNSTTQENIKFSRLKKRRRNLYIKENFKPEIKPMIENLQDKAKSVTLHANIRWDLENENCSKAFFKVLERHNLQYQTISALYTDGNKPKYSNNSMDICKSAKNFMKLFTPRRQPPKLLLLSFLARFLPERKCLINNLTFVRRKYL